MTKTMLKLVLVLSLVFFIHKQAIFIIVIYRFIFLFMRKLENLIILLLFFSLICFVKQAKKISLSLN